MMKNLTTLTFEELDEGLALLTMNRPGNLNSINATMLDELDELFAMLESNQRIRVIIVTGAGEGFCSGADLDYALTFADNEQFSTPDKFLKLVQERYASIILNLRRIPQMVIAAVNGPAAGGGFCMALASDVRIASPEAYFVASFINIGLSGGELGSSFLLPRLVGLSRATEILTTGRKVGAAEAEQIGLISKVVGREELIATAKSYAKMMLSKSASGLKLTKRVLDHNLTAACLEAAIDLENRNQTIMVFSEDFFRLVKSFIQRRRKT